MCSSQGAHTGSLASITGNSTMKVAPSPATESTATLPPMRSTSMRVMYRPRPVPPWVRRSEPSACENFSNMRARNFGSMPGPRSRTLTLTTASVQASTT